MKLNNYKIYLELQFLSDHTSLTINIIIEKEFIQQKRCIIIKNSKDESEFIYDFIKTFQNINIRNIITIEFLESIVQEYADILEYVWQVHSWLVNITR